MKKREKGLGVFPTPCPQAETVFAYLASFGRTTVFFSLKPLKVVIFCDADSTLKSWIYSPADFRIRNKLQFMAGLAIYLLTTYQLYPRSSYHIRQALQLIPLLYHAN
jgi:hypothetical protein